LATTFLKVEKSRAKQPLRKVVPKCLAPPFLKVEKGGT
jgi:hypothetical protein